MSYYKRIGSALSFIENNLQQEIKLEDIASSAAFSQFHFQRIFKQYTGEKLWDYVRKRRASRAAIDLIKSDKKVCEIAFDYQFSSHEAFSREFKKIFHHSPSHYRKKSMYLIAYQKGKICQQKLHHLMKNISIIPQIKEIESISIVGASTYTSIANNAIYKLWEDFMPDAQRIENRTDEDFYELSPCDADFNEEEFTMDTLFKKVAGVRVNESFVVPEGMAKYTIDQGKYAIFVHKGYIKDIQITYDYIHKTWLPNSNYNADDRISFEKYGPAYLGHENPESELEIYLPIIEK